MLTCAEVMLILSQAVGSAMVELAFLIGPLSPGNLAHSRVKGYTMRRKRYGEAEGGWKEREEELEQRRESFSGQERSRNVRDAQCLLFSLSCNTIH